jgi:serine/threonine-protein kinase
MTGGAVAVGEVFLGRYEVECEVGQGGMAVVHRGADHVLGRPVAIKVLHAHLLQKEEARARFAREARVIARLRHPGIVEVYDYSGAESDRAFIVTEFVDGESLDAFFRRVGALPPEVAALVAASAGDALAHAHGRGVIHRDVKPENLMVRRDGVLKLMDFGIAHVVDMEHLTMTGTVLGSPAHMSPEQVDGRALDARTDVFSLGTMFYLLATGRYPFQADSPSAMLRAIAEVRFPDPRSVRAGFPDDLHVVLMRMMARDPDERYVTAREATDDLLAVTSSLGFGPPSTELPRLFADPAAYVVEASQRVADVRLRRAREHLAHGRQALAIREADAALAARPGDPEARKVLDRARQAARRRRLSRTVVGTALGILALAGAVVAAALLWQSSWLAGSIDSAEAAPPVEMRDAVDGAPRTAPRRPMALQAGAVAASDAGRDRIPRVVESPGNGRPSPRPSPPLLAVTIQAHPPAVQIEVDGRVVGEGKVEDLLLPPGRHLVHLSHPSCDVCRDVEAAFLLDPAAPLKGPLRLSIGYRDAGLVITGPSGGRVFVNDEVQPRGRTNEAVSLVMTSPGPVAVKVRVDFEGREPRVLRAMLHSGRTTTIETN